MSQGQATPISYNAGRGIVSIPVESVQKMPKMVYFNNALGIVSTLSIDFYSETVNTHKYERLTARYFNVRVYQIGTNKGIIKVAASTSSYAGLPGDTTAGLMPNRMTQPVVKYEIIPAAAGGSICGNSASEASFIFNLPIGPFDALNVALTWEGATTAGATLSVVVEAMDNVPFDNQSMDVFPTEATNLKEGSNEIHVPLIAGEGLVIASSSNAVSGALTVYYGSGWSTSETAIHSTYVREINSAGERGPWKKTFLPGAGGGLFEVMIPPGATWVKIRVTSALGSQTSINPIRVNRAAAVVRSGLVNTSESPVDGRQVVTTSGTPVQFSDVPCRAVAITAETDNTGIVVVGASTVVAAIATRRGTPMSAGDTVILAVTNLNYLWLDAMVNGDGVTYIALQ